MPQSGQDRTRACSNRRRPWRILIDYYYRVKKVEIQIPTIDIHNSLTSVRFYGLNVEDKPSNGCTDCPVKSYQCSLKSDEKVSLTLRRVRRCH